MAPTARLLPRMMYLSDGHYKVYSYILVAVYIHSAAVPRNRIIDTRPEGSVRCWPAFNAAVLVADADADADAVLLDGPNPDRMTLPSPPDPLLPLLLLLLLTGGLTVFVVRVDVPDDVRLVGTFELSALGVVVFCLSVEGCFESVVTRPGMAPNVLVPTTNRPEGLSDTGVPDSCIPGDPGNSVVPAIENPVGFAVIT